MKREAFVWRASVYKNDFKCNQCGYKLAGDNSDGEPNGDVLITDKPIGRGHQMFCPKCNNFVAYTQTVDVEEGASGLMGNLDEYLNKHKGENK